MFWNQLLQNGGRWNPASTAASISGGMPVTSMQEPQFSGDPQGYPFWLVPFAHNTLGVGEAAHLPWLQAAPDPVTSVTWQTWVSLHPRVAAQLGVGEGDIVSIESPRGRVDVPVYVSPAAPPEVVSIPFGQGHTAAGRWAKERGVNPMQLLEPLADATTGALAYAATRVKITRTARSMPLPKLEGSAPARQLSGQEVVKVVDV
jgi:molybdopterin-containing oxidoreductase family iron-sulfur binding subunit